MRIGIGKKIGGVYVGASTNTKQVKKGCLGGFLSLCILPFYFLYFICIFPFKFLYKKLSNKSTPPQSTPINDATQSSSPPKDGGDDKPPFYRRPWFIAIVVFCLLSSCISRVGSLVDDSADDTASAEVTSEISEEDSTTDTLVVASPEPEVDEEVSAVESTPEPSPEPESTIAPTETPEPTATPESTPESTESTDAVVAPVVVPDTTAPAEEPAQESNEPEESSRYVGSIESDKYHYIGCRYAETIEAGNEIYFDTIEEAQAAGYTACGVCNPK